MNLPRLRELHAAWQSGAIRADELTELRDMLPEVMKTLTRLRIDATYCARALIKAVDHIEAEGVDELPEVCAEHRVRALQVIDALKD